MSQSSSILLNLLFWGSCQLFAQQQGTEWLTIKDGLSQGFVSCVLQDREGFVWAGTKNGLNRYDGYHFEVFTHDPFDEHSLSGDYINSVSEFDEFLILCVNNSGINLFHKKTRQVYRITNDLLTTDFPSEKISPYSAIVDAEGSLWVLVFVPGHMRNIYKITLPSGFWKAPEAYPNFQRQLKLQTWPDKILSALVITKDLKTIYASTARNTIVQIETQSNSWTKLIDLPPAYNEYSQLNIDSRGLLWCSVGTTIGKTQLYQFHPGDDSGLLPVRTPIGFENILCIDDNYIWMDQFNALSVFRLNEDRQFDLYSPEIPPIAISPGQYCGMVDQSGLSWIGTNGLGLMKINLRSRRFQHLFPKQSICSNILLDHQGNFLATNNAAQYLFSPGQPNLSKPPYWDALSGLHPEPRILQDGAGVYWVAGVFPASKNIILKKIEPGGQTKTYPIPTTIEYYNQFTVSFDEQGHLWMGIDNQLVHFNPFTERFEVYDYSQKLEDTKGTMAMAKTADGSWWIGKDNCLVQAKCYIQGSEFNIFKNDPKNRNSLRSNNIASLLADPADPAILWIGTKGGGLNRLDTRTLQFSHLTIREGLPNDVIYSILADGQNRLWMSSNKGLICYTPSTGAIKNYTKEDGLQDYEFNTWAFGKGPDGTLLFGGVNGLTVFHPSQLLEDTLPPYTHITGLRINDQEVFWKYNPDLLKQSIEFTSEISLPFSQNNLTLNFVALNFTSPDNNRFRYYLEGAENEWEHESSDHSASYLNLAPGNYVFHVKGANSEGVWSNRTATLKITILPPWYSNWLAWIIYVMIIGMALYAFYLYQLRTKLQHAENQRLKDLDTFKSRFFTNITHEFRTPLTVILGMTEQVKKHFSNRAEPEHNKSVDLLRRNGQNLLHLINQILDLSKMESGKLQLNLEKSDVIAFSKHIVESLQSFATAQKIQFHFWAETAFLEMDFDKEKMQAILSNLLTNAIKFTPEGGHVYINIDKIMHYDQAFCQIKIRDTGIGISEEVIEKIFELYYQADNSATRIGEGTGIGLTLTKELIRLMGGEISVSSKYGIGSTFVVTIPITTNSEPAEATTFAIPIPLRQERTPHPSTAFGDPEMPLLLVVEDNDDLREYLISCVSQQYQIAEARNGRIGIEKAFELIPDLIISDVMMPEKDGFELCQTLKNDERTSHIPLILLTAKVDVSSRLEGLSRGADDYIAKPFDRKELEVRLHNLIKNRRRLQMRYASLPLPAPSEDPDLKMEDAFLLRIREIVEAHISDADFEMPQLERALGMSRSQIYRKVKALRDQPPTLFIRSIRLHKAKELLQSSQLTIAEIAYEVGFTTPSYFSTAFLEEFGKNPSDFR